MKGRIAYAAIGMDGLVRWAFVTVASRWVSEGRCRIHQDGDDGELTVLFDVADFNKIAKVMRPHRKRQWSEEQKRQASERLAKYQYTPVVEGQFSEHTGVGSTGTV